MTAVSDMSPQEQLFDQIKVRALRKFNNDSGFYNSIKTIDGRTQRSSARCEKAVSDLLKEMELDFIRAGTQKHGDFRNVGGIGLSIEVKKTDTMTIKLNDSIPRPDVFYIFFVTKTKEILFYNGKEMLHGKYKNVMRSIRWLCQECIFDFKDLPLNFYPRPNIEYRLNRCPIYLKNHPNYKKRTYKKITRDVFCNYKNCFEPPIKKICTV